MNKGEPIEDGVSGEVAAMLLAYVAGDLPAEEQEAFERRLLEDELLSRQVEEARFLLLDAYAEGSLTGQARERVAAWAASSSPARRQVAVTRSLLRLASPAPRRSALRRGLWVLAAAACLAAAVMVPLLRRERSAAPAALTAKVRPRLAPFPAKPETILLVAERLRGAEPAPHPPADYRVHTDRPVRLQVVVPPGHGSGAYAIAVRRAGGGAPVAQWSGLAVQGSRRAPFVEAVIPARALAAGEYAAEVRAPGDRFAVRFRIVPVK